MPQKNRHRNATYELARNDGCVMDGHAGSDLFRSWFPFPWVPNAKQSEQKKVEKIGDYWLAVIEFDDQGWFQDPEQRKVLEKFLRDNQNEDFLILVFIHGWKHNAERNDKNLQSFCGVLSDACFSESHRRKGRQILGVYLSWRGLSLSGSELLMNASFWARKKVATKVALGCVREILALLRAFQADRNGKLNDVEGDVGTRLIFVGHSFGGLILFTAVSEYLIESVIRCICSKKPPVRPFGDLIILINPAFEAARYLPLYSAALRAEYPPDQRPCFLAVTSKNDHATKYWFPIGRWFSTRLESVRRNAFDEKEIMHDKEIMPPPDAQGRSILHTVGHLRWLTTHQLSCPIKDRSTHQTYKGIGHDKPDWDKERQAFNEFNKEFRPSGHVQKNWKRTYSNGAILEHLRGKPDNPFWTIQATPEVVDGHNGIFGNVFLNVLRQVCDDRLQLIASSSHGSALSSKN